MGAPGSLFEVEAFLKNLFSDPLILGTKNNFVRKMLSKFIIRKRLLESKASYQAIGGRSPLTHHAFALCNELNTLDHSRFYTYAMRYTPPFALQVLEDIRNKGIDSICLFSLYPQFSYSTTYSSLLDVKNALNKLGFSPTLSFVESYPAHPLYIQCILQRILETLQNDNPEDFTLILSAHSLPQSRIAGGDPYQKHCEQSAQALESALTAQGIHFQNITLAYQSKIDQLKCIGPSTKQSIARHKSSKILIFPLSFSLDNVKTNFELKIAYAHYAKSLNVHEYRVCECLNSSKSFAQSIISLIELSTSTQEFLNV